MDDLTHITPAGTPAMVDVSAKPATLRTATATAIVDTGPEFLAALDQGDVITAKGPVFQTAIVAGIQAAKRTADLIPMCHTLPLDHCRIEIVPEPAAGRLIITCRVQAIWKTGVEMEALTGVTIAALTVYDMGKSISKAIAIRDIRLIEKTGGKSDDYRAAT